MNHTITHGVDYITNIPKRKGEPVDPEKIIKGHKITMLDKCYEMLDRTRESEPSEVRSMNAHADYLRDKDIPFAITTSHIGRHTYNRLYVHGTEIVRKKSESKKLSKGVHTVVDEDWKPRTS